MAAPNAPMPLSSQVKANSSIVVTVPLRGMGASPGFVDGGTTFNSGDPTATYTINTAAAAAAGSQDWQDLCDTLDCLQREGVAVVT